MAKRHEDALAIQKGACNPSGIVHSMKSACKEIMDAPYYKGTDDVKNDPALQLMIHQLAYICNVPTAARFAYDDKTRACEGHVERDQLLYHTILPEKAQLLIKDATPEQVYALKKVYAREWDSRPATFLDFLDTASLGVGGDCIMVSFANMWLGIEKDGHTHS